MEGQQRKRMSLFTLLAILLTCIMLILGILSALISRPRGFDPGSYVFSLAQQAQDERRDRPSARNYCVVALFSEDTSGKMSAGPRALHYGFGKERNTNHCEQRALDWVARQGLPTLFGSIQLARTAAIHILLFTQVRACDPCIKSFDAWQRQLQQQAAAQPGGAGVQVNLYVWEITYGSPSGFDPGVYEAGPFTPGPAKPKTRKPVPVRPQDLDQVYP